MKKRTPRSALSGHRIATLGLVSLLAGGLALGACGDDDAPATDTSVPDNGAPDTSLGDAEDDVADDTQTADTTEPPTGVTVRYHRADGDYAGWSLEATGDVTGGPTFAARETDGFGAVFDLPTADGATSVTFRFVNGDDADPADAFTVSLGDIEGGVGDGGIWHFSGAEAPLLRSPPAIPGDDQLVVYYLRDDDAYAGWGLHLWEDVAQETTWQAAKSPGGIDDELGAWFVVDLLPDAAMVGVIVHKGDEKDPGPDMFVQLGEVGDMVFLVTGSTEISPYPVGIPDFAIAGARGHWLTEDTLAWTPKPGATAFELRYAADASVEVVGADVVGGEVLALTPVSAGLSAELKAKWPHLAARGALTLDSADLAAVPDALRGEVVLVARDAAGLAVDATRVQIPGVLDDLYFYDGPLGVTFDAGAPRFAVWAPTAQNVRLRRFDDALTLTNTVAMTRGTDGVWRYDDATAEWVGDYYRYEVTAFHPITAKVEVMNVTDPYSVSLSEDSTHSHIIDLADPAHAPAGWDALQKPPVDAPEDIVIYEGHVRDFSAHDATVAAADRGKYRAFLYTGEADLALSDGMAHLRDLADAGLTHFHMLPTFDIATVVEDPDARVDLHHGFDRLCDKNATVPAAMCTEHGATTIRDVFASFDPTTEDAQALATMLRGLDSFNWGYDPFHYNVPEGSYASDAHGATRVLEHRAAVAGLWQLGLRVALDVVYNHTNAAGLGEKSVLDKVVPGYYHRLNADTGLVETSTCCPNTATEHRMMERLMVDSLVHWARTYKVDAFRFDLMGHHMKANMLEVRAALDELTLADDGVDGAGIYLYGEGWNFGEVVNGSRGVNATQLNMAGTGIGTFNDRLRDAVRGGGPFDGGAALRDNQGFANGVYVLPNTGDEGTPAMLEQALLLGDHIRVGMTGNLRTFRHVDRLGTTKTGFLIGYNGEPTGYTSDPQEVINYVSKHDNQTLFDILAYKARAGITMEERLRMQKVAVDTTLLGQGIPFLHMGVDLLRSKSMERDSYDSGDWFNLVDFSGQTNNWNVGLPNEEKDAPNWSVIGTIISDETIAPTPDHIAAMAAHVREMLAVRASTVLFRLRTEADVKTRVDFPNVGPEQTPGLIAMTVTDGVCAGDDLDPAHDGLVVLINATPEAKTLTLTGAAGYELHPTLAASSDETVQGASFDEGTDTFSVPAWTSAVFVLPQGASQGDGPACNPRHE